MSRNWWSFCRKLKRK